MNIKQQFSRITPLIAKAKTSYDNLSAREQKLLLGGVAVMIIIGILMVMQPISSLFSEQALELAKVEQEARNIGSELTRYQRLVDRRKEVEQEFKSVDLKDGALSHLEGLIRDKAGISQGAFTIKDQPPKSFGNGYQQTFFTVNFSSTDYARLIDFLQELVDGAQPLVLKRLDVKRSRSGDKMDIDLEISSISK
jgi:hypothetical protein